MLEKSELSKYLDEVKRKRKANKNLSINDRVLLIDGLNMFIRVFSSVPALNDNGDHVGGVIGFMKSLAYCIKQVDPTRCIVVFDGKGGSLRRRKIFPDYKSGRVNRTSFNRFEEFTNIEAEQASMRAQVRRLGEYLQLLPITVISIDHIEADDVIAYIATSLADSEVVINSTDKDFYQLVGERIQVWTPTKKEFYSEEKLEEMFNIPSMNILTYRVIDGDKSDSIPGVKGVGIKTLIQHFPEIQTEKITHDDLVNLAKQKKADGSKYKIFDKIIAGESIMDRNYKLMQLHDVEISASTKTKVRDIYRVKPKRLNTFKFKKMFIVDRLHLIIKNLDNWLVTGFSKLNKYAKS